MVKSKWGDTNSAYRTGPKTELLMVIYLFVAKSHRGVVISLVDPGGLEDHLVDQGSSDTSENGSKPVNLKFKYS